MELKASKYRFHVVLMSAGNTVQVDLSAVASNRTEAYEMVAQLPSILWKSRGVDVGISTLDNPRMEDCYFEGDDIPCRGMSINSIYNLED